MMGDRGAAETERPAAASATSSTDSGLAAEENAAKEEEFQVLANGARYKGQWVASKSGLIRDGQGELIYPDGGRYIGCFVHNKAEGHGVFHHADGSVYEGQWLAGSIHGEGKYTLNDGTKHVGTFVDGKQSGPGCETLPDGQSYVGEYLNGIRHGEGLCTWGQGHSYQGQWLNNMQHGEGICRWGDGRSYSGSWRLGLQHGEGQSRMPDGRLYAGQYENDQKHGYGTFTWPDGREFSGSWRRGKLHGLGWYTSESGDTRQGLWENGQRTRWVSPGEAHILAVQFFLRDLQERLSARLRTKALQVAEGALSLTTPQRCALAAKCAWLVLSCTLLSSSLRWLLPILIVNLVIPMMWVSKVDDSSVPQAFLVDFEAAAAAARTLASPRRLLASARDCARLLPGQGLDLVKSSRVAAKFFTRIAPQHRHLLREPLRST